jgi:hypothetical protein
MFTALTQTGTTTIKLSKISTSKQLLYKLCFTVEQPLIHEIAGLFPVKIEKKKTCCTSVNSLTKFKTKLAVKQQNTSFQCTYQCKSRGGGGETGTREGI